MKRDWQEELVLSSQRDRKGFGVSSTPTKSRDLRVRVRVIWSVFVVGFSLLLAKILYMQIIERGQHQLTSYENHVELKRELAPRGIVYDNKGVALVNNVLEDAKYRRVYPLKEAIAPILGYLSEVKASEIGCSGGLCYGSGMDIGRSGLEQSMEIVLRGRDGGRLVEVDSAGKEVRELGSNDPESGEDVHLTIDSHLQKAMYDSFAGRAGSAVAMDMQGKVLGLVSSPAYDPEHLMDYLSDTEKFYFLNRAIAGTYPPGSVYKLITAHAGLSEGKIDKTTEIEDTGEIKIDTYRYGNWYFDQYGKTEGKINLERALARSNDIYFYKVGELIGVESLVKWSRKLGLDEKTGIELYGEQDGLVPDKLWKERITGEKWFLGNTYHMSIGQGDLLVSPIQVARMTLASVSGRVCRASLLKDSKVDCSDLGLKTEHIETVREGMKQACSTGGTAFPFFDFTPQVLCKTGTAQHSGQNPSTSSGQDENEVKPHAWITVAYPGDNPQMILTVMLESAGEGSAEAGPIAKKILETWKSLGH